jgi:hypothetical protein
MEVGMNTFSSIGRKMKQNEIQDKNPDEKHRCNFGELDKKTKDKLLSITGEDVLFMKCKCGIVRPFTLDSFHKVCTNGILVKITKVLKKKKLYLHVNRA